VCVCGVCVCGVCGVCVWCVFVFQKCIFFLLIGQPQRIYVLDRRKKEMVTGFETL